MTTDLRNYTMARVALGRTGNAPPLRETLAFQLAHARARDAVHHPFNAAAVAAEVNGIVLQSAAKDRTEYLRRPDLGRRLQVHAATVAFPPQHPSAVFILADGLSPIAVERHAPALLRAVTPLLPEWALAQPVIVEQGRVAIGDEIGQLLNA
ncbi:MAG TPA: ethanolamine ammonia-lyase light chain EutC, partial [Bryobacteraceae bacterium]|nr:ethanolamine ammonia-lyase light chain EutC [Bryobacteraceae bacterium]